MINQLNLAILPTLILTLNRIVHDSAIKPAVVINHVAPTVVFVVEKAVQVVFVVELGVEDLHVYWVVRDAHCRVG
jgi:hypothetical protein